MPPNVEGMLLVSGPNVMQGYVEGPDLTSKVLNDGWYVTGDHASHGRRRVFDHRERSDATPSERHVSLQPLRSAGELDAQIERGSSSRFHQTILVTVFSNVAAAGKTSDIHQARRARNPIVRRRVDDCRLARACISLRAELMEGRYARFGRRFRK